MKTLFKPLPWYGMLGGFMSGPYIGSLRTLIFIALSLITTLTFDFGWMIPISLVIPLLTWAIYDWNTTHGKIAKGVYYQKDNLIVTRWIFNINRKMIHYCESKNLEYKQSLYRFWITKDGKTHLMYTFARFPWTSTVIGFEDEQSKRFFIKALTCTFQVKTNS
jgi:hypothetical protein